MEWIEFFLIESELLKQLRKLCLIWTIDNLVGGIWVAAITYRRIKLSEREIKLNEIKA